MYVCKQTFRKLYGQITFFRIQNTKFSGHYFYKNTNILGDFQICISVLLNISRPIYLKKVSAHRFEDHICTNKLEEIFFKDFELFSWLQSHWFGPHFFPQKNLFYIFFQMWLFNFNIIFKTCFKNLCRKTVKNWWFYSSK